VQVGQLSIVTQYVGRVKYNNEYNSVGYLLHNLHSRENFRRMLDSNGGKIKKKIALEMARGMIYLHSHSPTILHLDLKLVNVLYGEAKEAILADFGLAKRQWRTVMPKENQPIGTLPYSAPEVLASEHYGKPADVYSFGVCLWELWTGCRPWSEYKDGRYLALIHIVGSEKRHLLIPDSVEPSVKALLERCWAEPVERPTFGDIVSILSSISGATTPRVRK